MGGKALAAQHIWRILLNISRVRVWSPATHGACFSPCPHAHRATTPGTGWAGRCCRAQASGAFLAVSAPRHPWRPRCSVARQRSRSCCQAGTDGIGPANCRERVERCPPVRKSAVAFQSRRRASADDSVRNMTVQPPLAHPSEPPAGRVFQGSPAPVFIGAYAPKAVWARQAMVHWRGFPESSPPGQNPYYRQSGPRPCRRGGPR